MKIKINEGKGDGHVEVAEGISNRLPVVIISEGLGNLADRNYYTKEAILSGPSVYEGKKAYVDHPTPTEQQEQPGRSVLQTAGHYEDVKAVEGKDGRMELRGFLVPEDREDIKAKVAHALEYKKKYPDKDYIALSINGDGEGAEMEYADFVKHYKPSAIQMAKLKQIEGQTVYAITKFTDAVSADLVTEAGARGRFLSEQAKKQKGRNAVMKISEAFRNFFDGVAKGDRKMITSAEAAISSQLEDEDEKSKEAAKSEKAETEALVNAMLNAKKEMKKKEDESAEAYQARCMKQAMKDIAAKKEAAKEDEDEKKEKKKEAKADKEDEKKEKSKEGKKEDESEDEKKEKKKEAKKEDEDKSEKKEKAKEKKEDDGDDDDDDDDDADADDKKKMSKMKKENAELKAEVNRLRENEIDTTVSKTVESRRNFLESMDDMLAESGLSRATTKEMKPFLLKCKSVEEMKKLVEKFVKAHEEMVEEEFFVRSQGSYPTKEATDNQDSVDDCFE